MHSIAHKCVSKYIKEGTKDGFFLGLEADLKLVT